MIQNIATISVIYIRFFTNDIKKKLTYFVFVWENWLKCCGCVGRLNVVFSCRMNLCCLVWVPLIQCWFNLAALMWLLWSTLWLFRYYLAGSKFFNGVWEKMCKNCVYFLLYIERWFILLIWWLRFVVDLFLFNVFVHIVSFILFLEKLFCSVFLVKLFIYFNFVCLNFFFLLNHWWFRHLFWKWDFIHCTVCFFVLLSVYLDYWNLYVFICIIEECFSFTCVK